MLRPGYSPLGDSVSSLARGPIGWIQDVSFYCSGVGLVGLAGGVHYGLSRTRKPRFGASFLLLAGLVFILVAIFRRNLSITLCFLVGFALREEHNTMFIYSILTAFVLMLLFVERSQPPQWVWFGLGERIGGADAGSG
jgi:hypothetical protein